MGYPMTYQRVIHRNGLTQGDYENASRWSFTPATSIAPEHLRAVTEEKVTKYYDERLERFERGMKALLGDLRRLEEDSLDEGSICAHISAQTGIAADDVAAVLQAFIRW